MTVETREKCCPICGRDVDTPQFKRFGEFCCSEAHAEEHVKEVRAQKQAAAAPEGRPASPGGSDEASRQGQAGRLGRGCC